MAQRKPFLKQINPPTVSHHNNKGKDEKLKELIEEIKNCKCDLKDVATNTVFSDGQNNSKIMLIGEAPGADEDKIGKPFVGQAGQLLDKMFDCINLNRKKNFYITNLVFWRPPGNRTPTEYEINLMKPFLMRHIEIVSPKIIVAVGGSSAKAVLNIEPTFCGSII